MKYVITWSVPTVNFVSTMKKFLSTGAPAPEGVKVLGRYHGLNGSCSGFIVAEACDAKGIYTWLADWMDLMSFQIVPVVEDGDAAGILQSARA